MGEKRKYKFFTIDKINYNKRWHIGAFICRDDDEFYLLLSLFKWDICIGKVIDWSSMF